MPPLTAHFSAPFKIPSVYVCFTAVRINTPLRTEFEVFVAPDVPAIAMKHVPVVFLACEPVLYNLLLPTRFLVRQLDNEHGTIETPASKLCEPLGLSIDKIAYDITLKDYGLDSPRNWQVILVLKLALEDDEVDANIYRLLKRA